ncbi:PadR family transcriptional regulator [Paenibacillus polysaccharolyticus]|uniref:PadR family transcriptional regulator n=1 Tax=Paenibacillus cucumis (ex Kampfer et al. 2016) TaxID=1776858 RepID=A0ABS7KK97_9BACL|nr:MULTISPECIES: PadR family transcriptional regulator [Paenibacillus]MBY0204594.1 PadR family transcriptional regulator [Paenibacillus cucumis (ex Kampfer et al. 2016)]MCP1135711.1 PadR family transcriptional regulator [Paenibacillus polysaccharolyticus]MDP9702210.1 DNA-binding PadR family transcriptional regulator [Paenibacillus intestini]
MDVQVINSDLIRGNIDPIILSVLIPADNYGYGIIKEIYRKSGEQFELKEPTLYSSLKRLEKSGYVESYWGEETQGGRRKYYRISSQGREVYQLQVQAWHAAKTLIDCMIATGEEGDE